MRRGHSLIATRAYCCRLFLLRLIQVISRRFKRENERVEEENLISFDCGEGPRERTRRHTSSLFERKPKTVTMIRKRPRVRCARTIEGYVSTLKYYNWRTEVGAEGNINYHIIIIILSFLSQTSLYTIVCAIDRAVNRMTGVKSIILIVHHYYYINK